MPLLMQWNNILPDISPVNLFFSKKRDIVDNSHLAQITDGSMCFKSFEAVLYIMT